MTVSVVENENVDIKALGIRLEQVSPPLTCLISPLPQQQHLTTHTSLSRSSLCVSSSFYRLFHLSHPQFVSHLQSRSYLLRPAPDHVSPQQDIAEPSTEPESNSRKRRSNWNIVAIFKDTWEQHRRKKPLGEAPGVHQSVVVARFKTSCEYPTAR